jgi:hypothetical protein
MAGADHDYVELFGEEHVENLCWAPDADAHYSISLGVAWPKALPFPTPNYEISDVEPPTTSSHSNNMPASVISVIATTCPAATPTV